MQKDRGDVVRRQTTLQSLNRLCNLGLVFIQPQRANQGRERIANQQRTWVLTCQLTNFFNSLFIEEARGFSSP